MLKALRLLQEAKLELISNGTDEVDIIALDHLIANVQVSYEAKVGYNQARRLRRQLALGTTIKNLKIKYPLAASNLDYLVEVYCTKENNSDLYRSLGRFLQRCKNQKPSELVDKLTEPIIINRFRTL